jgi:hypothetical protein
MSSILYYIGSGIICVWGIAHLIPTKNIVNGFGKITVDNRRIITMEWVAEGMTYVFLGVLVFLVTFFGDPLDSVSILIYWACAGMLIIMAVLSLFTGARTSIVPMKLCPLVKSMVAVLFILGIIL